MEEHGARLYPWAPVAAYGEAQEQSLLKWRFSFFSPCSLNHFYLSLLCCTCVLTEHRWPSAVDSGTKGREQGIRWLNTRGQRKTFLQRDQTKWIYNLAKVFSWFPCILWSIVLGAFQIIYRSNLKNLDWFIGAACPVAPQNHLVTTGWVRKAGCLKRSCLLGI